MQKKSAYISAVGIYVPERILTNHDLGQMVETSDEWIVSRTGIRERRIARTDEYTSDMGFKAARVALAKAKMDPEEIELIIVATLSSDYIFPSTACLIQKQLEAKNAGAFDIQAACTGMIYAISVGKAFVESGMYKNILVIASEKISSIIDYHDRNTCVLFGDGAAACLITDKAPGLRIGEVSLGADGGESNLLLLPGGGCRHPATGETVANRMHYLKMDGKEIFRHAVRRMENAMLECLKKSALVEGDIAYLIPHQANLRIIEALAKRFQIPEERVIKTLELYGNTSASSIGLGLNQLLSENRVKDQDHLLLVAFGAGLTWGSLLLTVEGACG